MTVAVTDGSVTGDAGPGEDGSRADVAKQEASQISGTVKEQGAALSGAAAEGGQRVVAQAKEQVGAITQQVGDQLHDVLGRSQSELSERASEQTDKAAVNLRSLAGELSALADGRPEEASRVVGYVRHAADRAESYATRLDTDGFSGVASDLSRFARRRPGLFLLGAVATGFAAGRLARGTKASSTSGGLDAGSAPTGIAPPVASNPSPESSAEVLVPGNTLSGVPGITGGL
jgi:hypothetical protein